MLEITKPDRKGQIGNSQASNNFTVKQKYIAKQHSQPVRSTIVKKDRVELKS